MRVKVNASRPPDPIYTLNVQLDANGDDVTDMGTLEVTRKCPFVPNVHSRNNAGCHARIPSRRQCGPNPLFACAAAVIRAEGIRDVDWLGEQ